MAEDGIRIGALRWPVTISKRTQATTPGSSIAETATAILNVHADIIAVTPSTFVGGIAIDRPVTHWIRMRWLDWIDETHVIQRRTKRLDGTWRVETFRIRRVKEWGGRKRFVECETELESRA